MWFDKKPIIALAPMADLTDSPFCRVCREVTAESGHPEGIEGTPFIIFREMVSSEAIVRGNEKTLRMCGFKKIERPIVIQLFGSKPEVMAKAAEIVMKKFQPDGIDINMGCPVPKITGKNSPLTPFNNTQNKSLKTGAGAALMKNPELAAQIIGAVKKAVGAVSVKTRLGWAKDDEILEFAKRLEDAGVSAVTIHGRTKKEGYSVAANWKMISQVKKILSIPVIANGDIRSAEDAKRCFEETGADGIMIGRAALGNPWIFNEVQSSKLKVQKNKEEIKNIVLRHAKLHLEYYGEKSIVTFRKHLLYYFKGEMAPGAKELRKKLSRVSSLEELKKIFDNFYGC